MDISPTLYVYGYEINQVEGVKYLINKYIKWTRSYTLFRNHGQAMDAIVKQLSNNCGLTLHALPLWVGGHHMSYSIVFFGDSIALEKCTPEDTRKLVKLERLLQSMGISKTQEPKFKLLCSTVCQVYHNKPPEMARQQPPPDWRWNRGHELICLMNQLSTKHPLHKQKSKKRSQEKGSDGKQVMSGSQPVTKK